MPITVVHEVDGRQGSDILLPLSPQPEGIEKTIATGSERTPQTAMTKLVGR